MHNPVAVALGSLSLGPEVVVDNLTMIPLMLKDSSTEPPSNLDYLVLDDALASGVLEITELSEQGTRPSGSTTSAASRIRRPSGCMRRWTDGVSA